MGSGHSPGARGRRRGRARAGRESRGTALRAGRAAHHAADRRSRSAPHRADARDRRSDGARRVRGRAARQRLVVAPCARAPRGRIAADPPALRAHRRGARRLARRRPGRGARRARRPARSEDGAGRRRQAARYDAAAGPPGGGARGVRTGGRAAGARILRARSRPAREIRAGDQHLRDRTIEADARPVGPGRPARSARRRVRRARPRRGRRADVRTGNRGARGSGPRRPRRRGPRPERLDGGGRCGRPPGAPPRRRLDRRRARGAVAAVDQAGGRRRPARVGRADRSGRRARPADAVGARPDGMTFAGFARLVMVLGTAYFALWATTQILMGLGAALFMWRHKRHQSRRARALVERISTPFVSIVVPAHNEELTIVQSVRALLSMDYENREIVVVNDGSSDGTLAVLQRTFHLVAAPVAYAQPLPSAPVRGIYRSTSEPSLVVVDKESGGSKADASNAGINAASGELTLNMDADTVLEPDALSRAVLPFIEDPRTTVATGAKVAIVNGCRVENGRVTDVNLPRSWFARLQIVEYMRAFLLFRTATAVSNCLLILSGAFGLFRRDIVIAVGGFDRTAIGEDFDLTVRIQRHMRRLREPFRIVFDPSPLCCTQAPEDWISLRSQRHRWRRGLLQ